MGPIDIVVTMGGLGSRFRNAGYKVPKYMIEAKGKTLFEWSMESLEGYAGDADRYVFIALKDREADAEGFIREKCGKMGMRDYSVVMLDRLTDGQATTAMLAEKYWDPGHALLIYNIDTYVEPGEMNSGQLRGDGFIPCFRAGGDHWSFVRLDGTGRVAEVREKQRISDHCTLGAYYFRTCGLYKELYEGLYGRPGEGSGACAQAGGEKYVAPLYDFLIKRGGEVYIADVPPEKVHVLGTPEELQRFLEE